MKFPTKLLKSDSPPNAELLDPEVFLLSELSQLAVLEYQLDKFLSVSDPTAVLPVPVRPKLPEFRPRKVLLLVEFVKLWRNREPPL